MCCSEQQDQDGRQSARQRRVRPLWGARRLHGEMKTPGRVGESGSSTRGSEEVDFTEH